MGVVIPLFKKKLPNPAPALTIEQRTRWQLLQNSIEALKREEKSLEDTISKKCKEEIDRLNSLDFQIRKLEAEIQQLGGPTQAGTGCPQG
jgi:flagellar hook-associated protein FlgK